MPPAQYQQLAVLGEKEASGFQHTVGLGNYSAKQVSLGEVGCEAFFSNQNILYVSNEKVETGKIVYTVFSENGVDPQVFVYNARESIDPTTCTPSTKE
jgi:hypothetical protein